MLLPAAIAVLSTAYSVPARRKVPRAGFAAAQDDITNVYPFNSGFGFLTSARYVVRGRVFNSPSRL